MKAIVFAAFAVIALFACVPDAPVREGATMQQLCTIEDQNAGRCDGPAGGWQALDDLLMNYAASHHPGAISQTSHNCTSFVDPFYGNTHYVCRVTLDFGSFRIKVLCESVEDETPSCSSQTT